MRPGVLLAAIVICFLCFDAPAEAADVGDFSAIFRVQPQLAGANADGALAAANGPLGAGSDRLTTELELRGQYEALSGIVTWRHATIEHADDSDDVILNEGFASHQLGGWYFTLGKKIMSWDVGYAFRPLDVIQQEDRRRLITTTLEGVPLLAAEKFGETSAWTFVIANPEKERGSLGRDEPAAALRGYWRIGPADLYAVVRDGISTKWRAGVAMAYVANESLEWHASVLHAQHLVKFVPEQSTVNGIPLGYDLAKADAGWQALLGFTWTNAERVSIMVEAWHDDRSWDSEGWRRWRGSLAEMTALQIPIGNQIGLTARAAEGLGTPNLRRDSIDARISHTGEKLIPSADVLYSPADGGVIATARLGWTGDRINAEVGWRVMLGAADSIARQLPNRRILYASIDVSL